MKKKPIPQIVIRALGKPNTTGALRKILKQYKSKTSFGFRNQPMQGLYEVRYPDAVFVVFQ